MLELEFNLKLMKLIFPFILTFHLIKFLAYHVEQNVPLQIILSIRRLYTFVTLIQRQVLYIKRYALKLPGWHKDAATGREREGQVE